MNGESYLEELQKLLPGVYNVFEKLAGVLITRYRKYAGEGSVYSNFQLTAQLMGEPISKVFIFNIMQKISRIVASPMQNFPDESGIDSFLDLIGYAVLLVSYLIENE